LNTTTGIPQQTLGAINKGLLAILELLGSETVAAVETEVKKVPQSSDGTIQIWSDGACTGNPGPGGWGTVIRFGHEEIELSGYSPRSTNNIMEMTGALEGIRRTPEGSKITVTTDSQYLLKGMTQWLTGWKRRGWKKADGKPVLNKEIWMALDKEAQTRTIRWHWVRGHSGHPENERCDELARNAITQA